MSEIGWGGASLFAWVIMQVLYLRKSLGGVNNSAKITQIAKLYQLVSD